MSLGVFQFWKDVASQLRSQVPFVSEALAVLPLIESDKVPYAGTDNKSIIVNTATWAELEEQLEQAGTWFPTSAGAAAAVLLHECLHVVLKHKQRGTGVARRDIWARAVDITTNNLLTELFALPPFSYYGSKMEQFKQALREAGTFDERFLGKDTESIYQTLCEENPEDEEDESLTSSYVFSSGGESGSDSEPNDGQQDSQGAQTDGSQGQEPSQPPPPSQEPPEAQPPSKPLDNEVVDELESGVPDEVGELINNTMHDYLERNASFAPSGSSFAHEIFEARRKPPILMSQVLRKIRDVVNGTIYDYRKPSRFDTFATLLGSEGRMPSYHESPSDRLRQLIIAIDMSGSMGEDERQTAFSLVRDSFKHVKHEIRLLAFTDRVVQDEIITKDTKLTSNHSGGTNIASIIGYMDSPHLSDKPSPIKPSAVVIITDAYDPASMPLLERWKYKNRMRSIVIGSGLDMPGLVFHADCVDGFPRG